MNGALSKILNRTMYALFLLAFVWVSGRLFFERQTGQLMASVGDIFVQDNELGGEKIKNLAVIYADEPSALDPSLTDPAVWKRSVNIFEPLVALDRDLNVKPALAVEWGLIDDKTWEFRLRPGVKFHDGSGLDAPDVVASVERYKSFGGLKTVEKVEKMDDFVLRIHTFDPDPLLLQRIARVFIFPAESEEKARISGNFPVIGTGSYVLDSWDKGSEMVLERFDNYWGNRAKFDTVKILYVPDKSKRVNLFLAGEADLLDFVPYDAVKDVREYGFEIADIPSLQVESLFFNARSEFFRKKSQRQLVAMLIDQDYLVKTLGVHVRPVSQFVSSGIFGFNPEIPTHEYNPSEAKKLIAKNRLQNKVIQIHFPQEFSFLGEYLRKQLTDAGLQPVISYLEVDALMESMTQGNADMYFLGFRAELGDADDFFGSIVRKGANFNSVVGYGNEEVEGLISASLTEMDPLKRLSQLQVAMKIVIENDVIGVPLFEYQTLFAFNDRIRLLPRIDGFIYFDELIIEK